MSDRRQNKTTFHNSFKWISHKNCDFVEVLVKMDENFVERTCWLCMKDVKDLNNLKNIVDYANLIKDLSQVEVNISHESFTRLLNHLSSNLDLPR